MFKTLKVPIGVVIALSMSVLAISVAVVTKVEHNNAIEDILLKNTSALSDELARQLAVVMEQSPGNKTLHNKVFQSLRGNPNILSATFYDNN